MRGPGMRLKLDVRRLWQCPRCNAQRKLPADVTSVRCHCVAEPTFMRIVEPQRRVRPEPKPLDPVLVIDLDTPDENEVPATVTQVVTAVVVEAVIVQEMAQPAQQPSAGGPPPRRDDRRNKPRRQRDRRPDGNRPQQSEPSREAASPPSSETTTLMTTPPDHHAPIDPTPAQQGPVAQSPDSPAISDS